MEEIKRINDFNWHPIIKYDLKRWMLKCRKKFLEEGRQDFADWIMYTFCITAEDLKELQ